MVFITEIIDVIANIFAIIGASLVGVAIVAKIAKKQKIFKYTLVCGIVFLLAFGGAKIAEKKITEIDFSKTIIEGIQVK